MNRIVMGLVVFLTLAGTATAFTTYLKVGDVIGSSNDQEHREWIESEAFAVTVFNRPGSVPYFSDFSVNALASLATPQILGLTLRGERIPLVEMDLTTIYGGAGRRTFARWELRNSVVTWFQQEPTGPSVPLDTYKFGDFDNIKYTWTEYDSSGFFLGDIEIEWDLTCQCPATVTTTGAVDNFRFITSVPEPATFFPLVWWSVIVALCTVGRERRRFRG